MISNTVSPPEETENAAPDAPVRMKSAPSTPSTASLNVTRQAGVSTFVTSAFSASTDTTCGPVPSASSVRMSEAVLSLPALSVATPAGTDRLKDPLSGGVMLTV